MTTSVGGLGKVGPWYLAAPLDFEWPEAAQAHQLLAEAYVDRRAAIALAESVGVGLIHVNREQTPFDLMRDIMKQAAAEQRLSQLLTAALSDPRMVAYHAQLVALMSPAGTVSGSSALARQVSPPTPAYANAEVQALSEQLEDARARKQNLRDAGISTEEVDREILELRRKLREGGQLRAGDTLSDGRYLLVKQLGRGGFAVVWEAYDRQEQRRVAIKVLHLHLASDSQRRERFFRGARVMMDLKHAAVVRVYDPRGEDEAFCYFVMELVPGGNLRDAVLGQRIEISRRLPVILEVAEALAEAHGKQLVHRDVKPTNILLDEHGHAKLTDFDLVGGHDTTGGTRTGALGTVVYAAPECLHKPAEATARADVFGLGMTAIFCLSGQDLTMDTFRDPAETLAQLDCSVLVRNVLQRAVAWKPVYRFADASAMVVAIRRAMVESSQSGTAHDTSTAPSPSIVAAGRTSKPSAPAVSMRRREPVGPTLDVPEHALEDAARHQIGNGTASGSLQTKGLDLNNLITPDEMMLG